MHVSGLRVGKLIRSLFEGFGKNATKEAYFENRPDFVLIIWKIGTKKLKSIRNGQKISDSKNRSILLSDDSDSIE